MRWSFTAPDYSWRFLAVSEDDQFAYPAGYDETHPSAPGPSVLQKVSRSGGALELVKAGSDLCSTYLSGAAADHELILSRCSGFSEVQYGRDAAWKLSETYATDGNTGLFAPLFAAFDPGGNAIVLGETGGAYAIAGRTFGRDSQRGILVLKLSSTGAFIWGHELIPDGGDALAAGLQVSSAGTVVVEGSYTGVAHWAGTTNTAATPTTFALTLESSGASRWLRTPSTPIAPDSLKAALDPSGRLFLAGHTDACLTGVHVEQINLAGDNLGGRDLGCGSGGSLTATGISALGHDLLIGGAFQGPVDFGDGTTADTGVGGGYLMRIGG